MYVYHYCYWNYTQFSLFASKFQDTYKEAGGCEGERVRLEVIKHTRTVIMAANSYKKPRPPNKQ